MSVGLYGDSYAEPNTVTYQWPRNIGECKNYAAGGSDVFYSYMQFLKTHHLHKKILFVVTSPARWSDTYEDGWIHSSSGIWKLDNIDESAQEFLHNKIKGFHEFNAFITSNKLNKFCSLMLKDIVNTRPDTKFIHAFNPTGDINFINLQNQCIEDNIQEKLVEPLYNLTVFENNKVNVSIEYHDRPNHLTKESHKILAGLIKNFLTDSNRWFDYKIELFKNINIDMSEMY